MQIPLEWSTVLSGIAGAYIYTTTPPCTADGCSQTHVGHSHLPVSPEIQTVPLSVPHILRISRCTFRNTVCPRDDGADNDRIGPFDEHACYYPSCICALLLLTPPRAISRTSIRITHLPITLMLHVPILVWSCFSPLIATCGIGQAAVWPQSGHGIRI